MGRRERATRLLSVAALVASGVAIALLVARDGGVITGRELVVVDDAGEARATLQTGPSGATLTFYGGSVVTTVSVHDGTAEIRVARDRFGPQLTLSADGAGARLLLRQGETRVKLDATDAGAVVAARRGERYARTAIDGSGATLTVADGPNETRLVSEEGSAQVAIRGPGGTASLRASDDGVGLTLAGIGESSGSARLEATGTARRLTLSSGATTLRVGVGEDGEPFVIGESPRGERVWAPVAGGGDVP